MGLSHSDGASLYSGIKKWWLVEGQVTLLGCNYNLGTLHFIWAHVLAPCSPLLSECSVSAQWAAQAASSWLNPCSDLLSEPKAALPEHQSGKRKPRILRRTPVCIYICNQPCRRLVYTYKCILLFLKFHPFPCKVEYPELNRNPFFISYPFNPATRASYWTSLKGRRRNTEEMKIHKYSNLCSIPGLVINNGVFTGHCQLSHDCQTHCYY